MNKFLRFSLGVLLVTWTAVAAAADARQRFAERIPASTCGAVFTQDISATCAAFQKTGLGEALCGPAFAPYIAELAKRDLGTPLRMRPAYGFDWSELAQTHDPGGIVYFPLADKTLGTAWLFVPEKTGAATPACLTAASDYFTKKGYKRSAVERKGAKLTVFQPPAPRGGTNTPAPARVIFVADAYYGVASSLAAADALLAVEPAGSLANKTPGSKSLYTWNETNVPNGADLGLYLKPFELWELSANSVPKPEPAKEKETKKKGTNTETDREAAERLGFTGLKTVVGQLRFAPDKTCQWSITANLEVEQPYRGAMRALEMRPGQFPQWPTWLGTNFVTASCWGWDLPVAMKGIGNLYDQNIEPGPNGAGMFEDLLDGVRDDPCGSQVDMRKELFEKLGPGMAGATFAADAKAKDKEGRRESLYVADVRDTDKLLATFIKMYKDDEKVHYTQKGAVHVWTVDKGGSLFVESESETASNIRGLALGEGHLVLSTDIVSLDKVLAPATDLKKLAGDAGWGQLLERMAAQKTDKTALESLARLDEVAQPSYDAARVPKPAKETTAPATKTKPAAALQPEKPEPLGVRLFRWFLFGSTPPGTQLPYAAVPKFDTLRSGLPQSSATMSQIEGGWSVDFGVLSAASARPQ